MTRIRAYLPVIRPFYPVFLSPVKTPANSQYFKYGLASWRGTPWLFKRFHRHNEVELAFIEKGSLSYLFSKGPVRLQEGQFAVFWGSIPHQLISFSKGTKWNLLTVPLAWFLQWELPKELTQQILHGKVVIDPDHSQIPIDSVFFKRWHEDLKSKDSERRRLVLLESESRLRRLSTSAFSKKAKENRFPQVNLGKVERMAAFIANHYTQPLRVSQIAATAGLHPDYAVTLFRKTCGMGLIDYVTEHRISHAQRLLATTNQKILDIAFDAGFNSPSRFYTAFERACGQSPKKYRVSIFNSPNKNQL
jgi:AraC family transcriptional regulator, melibiose operon regulatory protein